MKILIITSEILHPKDTHTSSFELSLAHALKKGGADAELLSVFMITPFNLMKAMIVKSLFGFKNNQIAERFSFGQLARIFFSFFFTGKKYFVFHHNINGLSVQEGVGIHKTAGSSFSAFGELWAQTGMRAYAALRDKNQVDIIHGHSRFFLGSYLANKIYHQDQVPYIVTEHSSYYSRGLVPENLIPSIRKVYDEAATATAVSQALKDQVKVMVQTRQEIRVIGNTLDSLFMEPVDFRTKKASKDFFTILSVGSLDENKNQSLLIKAFAKAALPLSRLVIAGDGPMEQELKKLVDSLGVSSSVQFTGRLPKENIRELMLDADVLVVSSFVETFSVVVVEAQACGLPVISTNCGGPAELITPENGLLLTGYTEDEMARALLSVHKKEVGYQLQKIRENVLVKYGPDTIAREYMELYRTALHQPA